MNPTGVCLVFTKMGLEFLFYINKRNPLNHVLFVLYIWWPECFADKRPRLRVVASNVNTNILCWARLFIISLKPQDDTKYTIHSLKQHILIGGSGNMFSIVKYPRWDRSYIDPLAPGSERKHQEVAFLALGLTHLAFPVDKAALIDLCLFQMFERQI